VSETQHFSPAPNQGVEEIYGIFPNDATLHQAVDRLHDAGFDRSRLLIPTPVEGSATPEPVAATDNPKPEDDTRQLRTLHGSMAAAAASMAGAAVVVATGGAAMAAVAAAAGAGIVAGGGMFAANNAYDFAASDARDHAAAAGQLRLVVAVDEAAEKAIVEQVMRAAGATEVSSRRRPDAVISGQGLPA
jgi:hypothetical protein